MLLILIIPLFCYDFMNLFNPMFGHIRDYFLPTVPKFFRIFCCKFLFSNPFKVFNKKHFSLTHKHIFAHNLIFIYISVFYTLRKCTFLRFKRHIYLFIYLLFIYLIYLSCFLYFDTRLLLFLCYVILSECNIYSTSVFLYF